MKNYNDIEQGIYDTLSEYMHGERTEAEFREILFRLLAIYSMISKPEDKKKIGEVLSFLM